MTEAFQFKHLYFYRDEVSGKANVENNHTVYAYQSDEDWEKLREQLLERAQISDVVNSDLGVFVYWRHSERTPTFLPYGHWLIFRNQHSEQFLSDVRFKEHYVAVEETVDGRRPKDDVAPFENPVTREHFRLCNKRIIELVEETFLSFPFEEKEVLSTLQEELINPEGEWLSIAALALIAHAVDMSTPGQFIEADNSDLLDNLADEDLDKE